jgi:hypothetical protein
MNDNTVATLLKKKERKKEKEKYMYFVLLCHQQVGVVSKPVVRYILECKLATSGIHH